MTSATELTVVVLNWRTPAHTTRAVRALLGDGIPDARIVIVDNGSGDGTARRFRQELSGCRTIALDENLGFARANNIGARALPGKAFLFVNSDAFVRTPGSVGLLLKALDDPCVGVAVPRLLNEDLTLQPSVVPTSKPMPELVRASGLSRLIPNRFQPALGTHWDHSTSRTIQAATGAVLLIRGSTWDELGGFGERRFMYAEELDLFWRAAERGWRAQFVAEAEFMHLGGASAEQRWGDPQRAELVAHAHAAMIRSHLGAVRARLTIALMAMGVGVRAVFHSIRGDRDAARTQMAWFRGFLHSSRASR